GYRTRKGEGAGISPEHFIVPVKERQMKKSRCRFLCPILGAIVLNIFGGCKQDNTETSTEGSVPPSEALATFELEQGFQIELLASEPLLSDPVDMEIDEYGRLYVVEMPGYPVDKSGTGKIKLLS